MRWIVSCAVLSFTAICAGVYLGYDFGYDSNSPIGRWLPALPTILYCGVLNYLGLIRPIRQIIQELQNGWSFIDCLIYHCVALGFWVFILVPMVVESYLGIENGPDYFWGFIICCLIKGGSLLNRRQYRRNAETVNEFLACVHDPQKKFSGNYYPPRKTRAKSKDNRWTWKNITNS